MDFLLNDLLIHNPLFAQVIEDPDIIGQINDAWANFIETGQVWAFACGVFFGYIFAKFTSF